jgi:hypothetical protein
MRNRKMNEQASEKQISYIKILIEQTGAEAPDYNTLDKAQASKLIGELKAEKESRAFAFGSTFYIPGQALDQIERRHKLAKRFIERNMTDKSYHLRPNAVWDRLDPEWHKHLDYIIFANEWREAQAIYQNTLYEEFDWIEWECLANCG